jgi:chemotaxis protein MotB
MSKLNILRKKNSKFGSRKDHGIDLFESNISIREADLNSEEPAMSYTEMMQQSVQSDGEDLEGNWLISYADMMTLLVGFFVMLMSFSKIDSEVYEKARRETTKYFGGEYSRPMQNVQTELAANIEKQNLSDQVHLDLDQKGVALTFRGAFFFDSGSSDLRPEAVSLIKQILPIIGKVGANLMIVVEGHTDDNPINDKRFPSNWELSSYRASSVLRYLEELGFPKSQLRAIGFADTVPALPNRDKAGAPIQENQSKNRRVVIRIIKKTS